MDDDRPGLVPPPARDPAEPDTARAKYYFIAAHRVVGAALVVLGMMAMNGALDWGEGVGMVLAVVGFVDFFVVPLALARKWRSTRQ